MEIEEWMGASGEGRGSDSVLKALPVGAPPSTTVGHRQPRGGRELGRGRHGQSGHEL